MVLKEPVCVDGTGKVFSNYSFSQHCPFIPGRTNLPTLSPSLPPLSISPSPQITPGPPPPPSQTPLANSCQEEKFSIHPCGVAMATPSHLIPLGTLCKSPFAPQQAVKVTLPLQRQLVKFWGSPCKVSATNEALAMNFKDGALWETWGGRKGKAGCQEYSLTD